MKENQNTIIRGKKVTLVPYREEHVATYHQWMEDPDLQEATASEPLSEPEEYKMQKSWAEDSDKCTFIVLDNALLREDSRPPYLEALSGDVNLFFNVPEEPHTVEVEVMIANKQSRGRGLGVESLQLMMAYAAQHLGVTTFRAKISLANATSLRLVEKLGFKQVSRSFTFNEVTYDLSVDSDTFQGMLSGVAPLDMHAYEP